MRKPSVRVRPDGYREYTSGRYRFWLEHRVVIRELDHAGPLRLRMPLDLCDVHHIDADRQHNCPANLLVLDRRLHEAFSIQHATASRIGWYHTKFLPLE